MIFTFDKYRVKRDLEENVAQDNDLAEDEIDCSSLGFLPIPDDQGESSSWRPIAVSKRTLSQMDFGI